MLRIFLPRTTAGQWIYAPTGGSCALKVDVAPESAMQQTCLAIYAPYSGRST